jgi:hypothetical protein
MLALYVPKYYFRSAVHHHIIFRVDRPRRGIATRDCNRETTGGHNKGVNSGREKSKLKYNVF